MRRTQRQKERRSGVWAEPGRELVEKEQQQQRMMSSLFRSMKFLQSSLTLWSRPRATAQLRTSSSRWGEAGKELWVGWIFDWLKPRLKPNRRYPRPSIPAASSPIRIRATTSWWRKSPKTWAQRSPPPSSLCSGCCWITSASIRLRAAGGAPGSSFWNWKSR